MKLIQLIALLPFLALSYQAHAEEASFDMMVADAAPTLISTLNVTPQSQTFEVPIPNCGKNLHSVELRVLGSDVNLVSFGLRFSATRALNIPKNQVYKAGTNSGWIDLSPFQRVPGLCPTAIFATGSSAPGNATVQIFGTLL